MPGPIDWTEEMDATLRTMRDEGCHTEQIGQALGISRNAVVNRCNRLGMATGVRFRRKRFVPLVPQPVERDDEPLPAGSAETWGAISSQPWPKDADRPVIRLPEWTSLAVRPCQADGDATWRLAPGVRDPHAVAKALRLAVVDRVETRVVSLSGVIDVFEARPRAVAA